MSRHDLIIGTYDTDQWSCPFLPVSYPSALNKERCGACCFPFVTVSLLILSFPPVTCIYIPIRNISRRSGLPSSAVPTCVFPSDIISIVRYPSFNTCVNRLLDCICFFIQIKAESKHHCCGKNGCDRICNILFLQYPVQNRRLAHTDQIWFHSGSHLPAFRWNRLPYLLHQIRISPNMFSVRTTSNCFGSLTKLHCTVVNQHMFQCHFRIILCNFFYNFSPQSGRIQYVCFIYTCHLLC